VRGRTALSGAADVSYWSGVRAVVHCCVAREFGYEVMWAERCCGGIFTG